MHLVGCSRSPAPSQLPAARIGAAGSRGNAAFSPHWNNPEREAALLPRGLPGRPHRGGLRSL